MIDYIDFKRLETLSDGDTDVRLYQKIIKLSEEVGELSQEFLAYDISENRSKSASGSVINVMEETCDVINVAMDILNKLTSGSEARTSCAKCHDVAGFIELELMSRIYVIMDYYNDINYIIPMLWDVLTEHELSFERVDKFTVKSNDVTIKFIVERDEYKMRGFCGYGIIKMGHYD